MVRNSELPEIGQASKEVAAAVQRLIEARGLSQTEVGEIIHRAQSYASLRIKGMKSWTVEELDNLAPPLGFSGFFELMRSIRTPNASSPMRTASADSPTIDLTDLDLSNPDDIQLIADHADELGAVAKDGDILAEQEGMEELP